MSNSAQKHLSLLHGVTLTEADFSAALRRNVAAWRTELGLKEGSGTLEVAKAVSARITAAIQSGESDGLTLPALGKSIREAAKIGRTALLGSTSLSNIPLERLHELGSRPLYWQSRIVGEMRQHLVGLRAIKDLEKAFVRLLRDEENIKAIQGADGYRWVAELFCQGRMQKAHQLMSAVCKAERLDFKKLEWGAQFHGTSKEFKELKAEVRAAFNDLGKFQYREVAGYATFADTRCLGCMAKAHILMSTVCKAEKLDFKKLGWGPGFQGTTKDFQALRAEARAGFADLNNFQYRRISGYEAFADGRCQGSMKKAYLLMRAVCKAERLDFKKLGWGACFNGTTQEFQALRAKVRDGFADLANFEFRGLSGYETFATSRRYGSMKKAYQLMSAVCKAERLDFKKLGWGAQFHGTTKEFQALREEVQAGFTDLTKFQYRGMFGYQAFSDRRCQGSMLKAYQLMTAVCKAEKLDFEKLEWGAAFIGTTNEFQALRAKVRDGFADLANFEFRGLCGYEAFATSSCQGRMLKAYQLLSAVCKAEKLDFTKLEWGARFNGPTKEFQSLREEVQAGFTDLANFQYRGMFGYQAFSDRHCQGSMLKAYQLMSAVCKAEKLDFKKLGWGAAFMGTTHEFHALRSDVRVGFSDLSNFQYRGLSGYEAFSTSACQGRMLKAYLLMSAVCKAEKFDFKKLEWGAAFRGTTKEFQALRAKVLEGFADLTNFQYRGLTGYEAFATSNCRGNMLKAYLLMSAVCKAERLDFKKLGWGAQFHGTSKEFQELKTEVRAGFNNLPSFRFTNIAGYLSFAEEFCGGKMLRAAKIMRAICRAEGCDFLQLGWGKRFEGTTAEFQARLGG